MTVRNRPTVSFIIVNANGLAHLSPLLDSIRALDYPQDLLSVWVVDNASTDGSREWLREHHPAVHVLENATNEGFARPNNVAAARAEGEWLALINNDMRLDTGWLQQMLGVASETQAACVASRILNWDGSRLDFDGSELTFTGHGLQPGYGARLTPPGSPRPIPFACGGAMLIARSVFLEVGGFDERYFAYYEDVDLGWRLWIQGHQVVLAPQALAFHRHNATSKGAPSFQKRVLMERNALCSVLKNYEDEHLARILPAALLLSLKRMAVRSAVDPSEFRFTLPGLPRETKASRTPRLLPWQKVLPVLREQGLVAVARKGMVTIAEQILRRWGRLPLAEGGVLVDRDSYAHLVAIEEVVDNLPTLLKARAEIQAKRRRPDREIFHLFGNPLQALEGTPSYLTAHEALASNWGIADLFERTRPAGEVVV